jgi:hypothetical protein
VLSGDSCFITSHAMWLDRFVDMPPAGALELVALMGELIRD